MKLRIIVKTEIIRFSILLQEEFTGTQENIILAVKPELCSLFVESCVDRVFGSYNGKWQTSCRKICDDFLLLF
jgi:hypothetical protein